MERSKRVTPVSGVTSVVSGGLVQVVVDWQERGTSRSPGPLLAPARTAPAEHHMGIDSRLGHRERSQVGRRSRGPGDHPVVIGAGLVGLLAATMVRRRGRGPRDEPRVLGLGF